MKKQLELNTMKIFRAFSFADLSCARHNEQVLFCSRFTKGWPNSGILFSFICFTDLSRARHNEQVPSALALRKVQSQCPHCSFIQPNNLLKIDLKISGK